MAAVSLGVVVVLPWVRMGLAAGGHVEWIE
jgi:hypothetical protein